MVGEWPLDIEKRCGDDSDVVAPGCTPAPDADGEEPGPTPIAGLRSVFTSDVDVTITYRGGLVIREATGDPSNPERRTAIGFVDATFPELPEGEDEMRFFRFAESTSDSVRFSISSVGSGDTSFWPIGGSRMAFRPEPGETLTFAVHASRAGPSNLLGDHDPELAVHSSYSRYLSEDESESGIVHFALIDQDPDEQVLDDVLSSIERVAEAGQDGVPEEERSDAGKASFEQVFADYLGGTPLNSSTRMETPAADEIDGSVDDADGATLAPPPPPPSETELTGPADDELYDAGWSDGRADYEAGRDLGASHDDPDPDRPDYDNGYIDGWDAAEQEARDAGSTNTGREYNQPQLHEDPWFAVVGMVDGLQTEPADFQECTITPAGYPCVEILRHTHNNGTDHLAIAKVRLGAGDSQSDFDFALQVTSDDPTGDGWVVEAEWTNGDGEQPGWLW